MAARQHQVLGPSHGRCMPRSRLLHKQISLLLAGTLMLAACGEDESPPAKKDGVADTPFVLDGNGFELKTETTPPGTDTVVQADAAPTIASVAASAESTQLILGERTRLIVKVTWSDGAVTDPPDKAKLALRYGEVTIGFGPTLAVDAKSQPPVSLWKGDTPGDFFAAAVRPGSGEVVVSVDGVEAPPLTFDTSYPTLPDVRISLPAGGGAAAGIRETDSDAQIRLTTNTIGPTGLKSTIRFPAFAKAGDHFDIESPPQGAVLQINATIGAVGALQVSVPAGRVWIDQTDKGMFRGSFLGQTAQLFPIVGSFVVQRNGEFGLDILEDPVLLAESTAPNINTPGSHVGRASASALSDGRVVLSWRVIKDVTKADLVRKVLDTKTGVLTDLTPLVFEANTAYKDSVSGSTTQGTALGWSSVAESQGKIMAVWEGRATKGVTQPNQITLQQLDPTTLDKMGEPWVVSDEDCSGQCRPQIHRLPNSRWLIVWGKADGSGLRARRMDGNLQFSEGKPVELIQVPASRPSAAVIEDNVAVIWRTPDAGIWYKLYTSGLSALAPEQQLTGNLAGLPAPSVSAILEPPSFAGVFAEPASTLLYRRINLSGAEIGTEDLPLGTGITHNSSAGGQLGQVVIATRVDTGKGADAATKNQLRLTKVNTPTPSITGAVLGPVYEVPNSNGEWVVEPTLVYAAATNTYVLIWGGDDKGKAQVWVQRFR